MKLTEKQIKTEYEKWEKLTPIQKNKDILNRTKNTKKEIEKVLKKYNTFFESKFRLTNHGMQTGMFIDSIDKSQENIIKTRDEITSIVEKYQIAPDVQVVKFDRKGDYYKPILELVYINIKFEPNEDIEFPDKEQEKAMKKAFKK